MLVNRALLCSDWLIPNINLSNEPILTRMISTKTGTRVEDFRHSIRSRDRRCIISGEEAVNADIGRWEGFEAAHIFPLAWEGHWKESNFDQWITIPPKKGGSINSIQNGILLREDIHSMFDSYDLSINPDVCIPYI